MQHIWRDLDSADGLHLLNCQSRMFQSERVSLSEADKNLRQWADLHWLTVKARGLHPGIFLLAIPASELRFSLSLPWVQRLSTLIVGARHIFGHRIAEHFVGRSFEGTCAGNVS